MTGTKPASGRKQYAIADEVPEYIDYLTAGKAYEIKFFDPLDYDGLFSFVADNGGDGSAIPRGSAHLDGGNWRIVDEDDLPEQKDTGQ